MYNTALTLTKDERLSFYIQAKVTELMTCGKCLVKRQATDKFAARLSNEGYTYNCNEYNSNYEYYEINQRVRNWRVS